MTVVAQVWRDEVVARRGMIGQIGRQLVIWPDVGYAFGRLWIQPSIDIVEIYGSAQESVKKSNLRGFLKSDVFALEACPMAASHQNGPNL